ncbi:hypothetical protein [Streptomyces sp. NPDC093589]|uniref:hypothetical protein n=1 Tax=Streptomyces sp. NPDC093589 TaxID=3366043 RepID=UPI00381312A7
MPEPMTAARLATLESLAESDGSLQLWELLEELKRARRDADDQYMEADYWREGYRLAKGLSFDEIGAIIAVRDVSRAHPRPCRFPFEACREDSH